jgi:TRAP-type mannitol/chloroaromatic compound transport system substrate-binding protein
MNITTKKGFISSLADAVLALPVFNASTAGVDIYPFATYVNETDIRFSAFQRFADLVKEKTEGRVDIQLFSSAIPETQLCIVPGCAHCTHLENSEVFTRILPNFIDDLMLPGEGK